MNRLVIKTVLPEICVWEAWEDFGLLFIYSAQTVTCESKRTLPVETVVLEGCCTFSVMMGK